MAVEKDFWAQPCEGLEGQYAPVTESAICSKEKDLGVAFPSQYRRLMQEQNGGDVRRSSYYDGEQYYQLFVNGGRLSQLNDVCHVTSILALFMTTEEIEEDKMSFEHCCLERLIVLSRLDGHSLLCLDYGWMLQHSVTVPSVIVLEQDSESYFAYVEVLRFECFEQFVEGLTYYGYESESFFLGVASPIPLSELAGELGYICRTTFECRQDDRYGWFNFDEYYIGFTDNFLKQRTLFIVLSPNRHRSGTYLFQNRPEIDFVVKIQPRTDLYTVVHEDISDTVQRLTTQLDQETGCIIEQLLCPHPFGLVR